MRPQEIYNPSLDAAGPPSSGGSFGSNQSKPGSSNKRIVPPNNDYSPSKNISDSYQDANELGQGSGYNSQNQEAINSQEYSNDDGYESMNQGQSVSEPQNADSYQSQTEGARNPEFSNALANPSQSAKGSGGAQSYIDQYNPIKRIGAAKDKLVDDTKTAVRDAGKKIARDAVTPGTRLGNVGSMVNKAYQGAKGLSADPEAMKEEARERVRQFTKDKGKEFAKNKLKGAGKDAAKSAVKGAAKKGAKDATKGVAKQVGKQALKQGGKVVAEGALAVGETAAAFTGVGILVDILVDIALYLGFDDAFDGVVALGKGHVREARFLFIRAAMKILMGIILIIAIPLAFFPIVGFILVNILLGYFILGKIFKKVPQLQGFTNLEAAIIFVLWVISFVLTGGFIYSILYWICIESGKSTVGWLTITAIKVYSWFTDNAVNEICKHVGQIANGTTAQ